MPNTDKRQSVLKKNNLESKLEARRCIKTALLQLLKKKKFNEIRMTDIIRKSGISRMGVYNNYKSKEEIVIDLYEKSVENMVCSLGVSIRSNLEFVFRLAYRHKDYVLLLIDANLTYILLDMMNERTKDDPISFYSTIVNGLIYNSVIEWIKSGADEPVETAISRMEGALSLLAKSIETEKIDETYINSKHPD